MKRFVIVLVLFLFITRSGLARSIKQRKLERFAGQLGIRPPQEALIEPATHELLGCLPNQNAPAFMVPQHLREQPETNLPQASGLTFYSWDNLFPNTKFSSKFNGNAEFRKQLRIAARKDFNSDSQSTLFVNDLRSSLSGSWSLARSGRFVHTSSVLGDYNFPAGLDGPSFFQTLFDLCPESPFRFASWMDIVGVTGRTVKHSWHQDSGRMQRTAMIGFPKTDNYDGIGVFSHAVLLSHRLSPPPLTHNEPRLWTDVFSEEQEPMPEFIVRPRYIPGEQEIMVYDDPDIFHSAPDFAHRDSVWRLM